MRQTKRRTQQAGKSSTSSGLEPVSQPQQPQEVPDVAVLPDDELPRVSTYKLSPAQEEILRSRLLSKIMPSLLNVSCFYLQHVARFVSICERYDGDTTPAEQFVMDLVGNCDGLTPDDAVKTLEAFRDNFKWAMRTARWMAAMYPDLVTSRTDESYQDVA